MPYSVTQLCATCDGEGSSQLIQSNGRVGKPCLRWMKNKPHNAWLSTRPQRSWYSVSRMRDMKIACDERINGDNSPPGGAATSSIWPEASLHRIIEHP